MRRFHLAKHGCLLALVLVSCTFADQARELSWLEITGKVTRVKDGNNLTIRDTRGFVHVVTLAGIDAPELSQRYGFAARNWLMQQTRDKQVRMVHRHVDAFGRTLGRLYVGEQWLNRDMVAAGLAWHCDPDAEMPELAAVQQKAQEQKRGLWTGERPIPPWHYRRGVYKWREKLELELPPRRAVRPSTNEPQTIGGP